VLIVLFLLFASLWLGADDDVVHRGLQFQLVAYTTFAEVGICHYLVNGRCKNYFWDKPARLVAGKE
jgi:hypothetical protein